MSDTQMNDNNNNTQMNDNNNNNNQNEGKDERKVELTNKKTAYVGIDFGTGGSGIYFITEDMKEPQCIYTPSNDRFINSTLTIVGKNNFLVGQDSKLNPSRTISYNKRMLGRLYDCVLDQDINDSPYEVISNEHDTVSYRVKLEDGQKFVISSQRVAEEQLKYIMDIIHKRLDSQFDEIIICTTCPAFYSVAQRSVLAAAHVNVGYKGVFLAHEPTAGLFTHLKSNLNKYKQIVKSTGSYEEDFGVFDMGAGTTDITQMHVYGFVDEESGNIKFNFDTMGIGGNNHLGGMDVDKIIMNDIEKPVIAAINQHFGKGYWEKLGKENQNSIKNEMLAEAEKIKCDLGAHDIVNRSIRIYGITINVLVYKSSIASKLDGLYKDFEKIWYDSIKDIGNPKKLLLIGGGADSFFIRSMMEKITGLKNDNIITKWNPRDQVAKGAAYIAKARADGDSGDIRFKAVVSNDIRIRVKSTDTAILIPRGSEIPVQNSNTFQNGTDGVTGLSADIYEGQHEKIYSLSVLGTCRIETRDEYGLGQLKMRVVVKIDGYGLMHVTAEQKGHPENKGTFTCTINIDDDSAYQRGDEYKEQKNDEEDIEMAKKVEAEFMHFMNELYVYKGQNDIVDTNWRIWEEVLRTPNRKIEHVKKLTLTLEEILAGIKDNEEKKKKATDAIDIDCTDDNNDNDNIGIPNNASAADSTNDVDGTNDVAIKDSMEKPVV